MCIIHFQFYFQMGGALHFFQQNPGGLLHFLQWGLHQQFIVNLQQKSGLKPLPGQTPVDPDHGDLDDIRSRALNGRIHGHPLPERPLHEISGKQFRHRPSAAEKGRHISVSFGPLHGPVQKFLNLRIGVEILFNIVRRFLPADAEILAQAEGTDAVDNAEIYRLGISSLEGVTSSKGT